MQMRISLLTWLCLMQFTAVFFEMDAVLVSGECLDDQRELLLQLKNSLNFNTSFSFKLVKWNQSPDCCMWEGVGCDAGGHVTDLDLSSESISSGVDNSSSLFNLQYLQSLNLAFNRFNSTFPSGFNNLANLSNLNLSNAVFTGQIPQEISSMKSLVTLDLSVNVLLGSPLKLEYPNLRMLVQNLKELKHLYLDGINISAQGKEWCQALSSSLPNLKVLSMSNCNLSGPIDSSLSKLQSLSVIRLDGNNLSAPIPEFFVELRNLTSLQLAATNLQGKVPEQIFQVLTLKNLDLSDNPFLEGSLKEFLPASSLETLLLGSTRFGGTLPKSIGNLERLSRIELARCNFNGTIPKAMGNLTRLVSLDFAFNRFSGSIPSFSSAKNLTELNFAHNQLTGSILSTEWSSLSNLVSIDLRNNSLHGSFPTSLFGIPSLQKIQLTQNKFTGRLNEFTASASPALDTLDLASNKLTGPLPMSIFHLRSLKILVLSSNNFSGPVNLSSFQQLKNLSTLDLSFNSLSINGADTNPVSFPQIHTLKLASCNLTRFPTFLKDQSKLNFLDLSENQIDGEIPTWIWNIRSLNYLNLSHNFLVNLPKTPQALNSTVSVLDLHGNQLQRQLTKPPTHATYLDYSSNNFSSVIPANIGDFLKFTYFFSLSNNNLHGSIPESICNATYLSVLDLSNNYLNGTIPQCLIGMESLVVLNLRGNNISGNISDTFSSKCQIKTLDLSRNHLEGKIPRSLANCRMLEVLDLGNNLISDFFPCHLNNISSLHVLVLRSNDFRGGIGCPNDSSSWSMLQIVDLASNHFSGKLPDQRLRTWKAMMDDEDELELQQLHFEFLPLNSLYYQDSITVTMKGLELQLVKILTLFTSIDVSCNKLEGTIPEAMGELRALYVLNLSHNALTGSIPSSLGNLRQLESLDLSSNNLTSEIPQRLSDLYFLAVLNLSNNQLVGPIPTSNQFQTFSKDSFEGNKGLCGPPLTKKCDSSDAPDSRSPLPYQKSEFDWKFILTGLGFGVGAAVVVAPLMFCKRASKWVDDSVDKILLVVLPIVGLSYNRYYDEEIGEDENLEEDNPETSDNEDEEAEEKNEEFQGRYCVFCSKIDIVRKEAVHGLDCICHDSPPTSFSSSTSSSFSS